MKYIIFLGDGMADLPVEALGHLTPLQVANKPNMDRMASHGTGGLVKTVPDTLSPGSDTANMSVMGYDPQLYYTGRSPLEAISMSIEMEAGDVAFRTNLVTLTDEVNYRQRTMIDYSSDEIGSDEAARLIEVVNERFATEEFQFYPGKSYRHCLIWKNGPTSMKLVPPHDILTQKITSYLPSGDGADKLLAMMEQSAQFLPSHPVNKARVKRDLRPANSIWIWGQGTRPELPVLSEQYGLKGSVISAVDLINGLGICAGLRVVEVPGVTGNIHTNFRGKAEHAIMEFKRGQDYVYLHVEAPDECGHRAEIDNKVKSIELIDREIIGPVWEYLEKHYQETGEDYRIMVLPDHPTPLALRTHTNAPVPFAAYSSDGAFKRGSSAYDEVTCQDSEVFILEGHTLFGRFIAGTIDA